MLTLWRQARDVFTGTRAVRANLAAYLPRLPGEDDDEFKARGEYAELYNAYRRTVRGMAGQVFKKAPQFGDDVPARIQRMVDDVDGRGNAARVFLQQTFTDALSVGCSGIFVDAPQTRDDGEPPLNLALEEQLGVRPYWVRYDAEDVISWRFDQVDGHVMLTQLVLRETVEFPDGDFGVKDRVLYKVYQLDEAIDADTNQRLRKVRFEEWEEIANPRSPDRPTVKKTGKTGVIANVDRIPFVMVMLGTPTSGMTAEPPLQDLLDLNIGHFRVLTDRRWLMHQSCVPFIVRKGYKAPTGTKTERSKTQRYGPSYMWDVPADGDVQWAELSGSSLEPTGAEIKEIEKRMAAIGLAFLAGETRAAETAEAKVLDASAQNATLSSCADLFDDAIGQVLALTALHMQETVAKDDGSLSGGSFATNREFEKQQLDAGKMGSYATLQANGQITLETLWKILERAGELPDDFDPKDEKEQLAIEAEQGQMDDPALDPADPSVTAPGDEPGDRQPTPDPKQPDSSAAKGRTPRTPPNPRVPST
jgi:Domain of unknown function (DUF4055)